MRYLKSICKSFQFFICFWQIHQSFCVSTTFYVNLFQNYLFVLGNEENLLDLYSFREQLIQLFTHFNDRKKRI